MKTLEIRYPDYLPDASRLSRPEFERDMKLALAAKLFEMGRVTSGQAAEIAGVSRYTFLHGLSRFRVNAIDWDSSEFEDERENA